MPSPPGDDAGVRPARPPALSSAEGVRPCSAKPDSRCSNGLSSPRAPPVAPPLKPSLPDTRDPLLSKLRTASRGLLVLQLPYGTAKAKTRELDAAETFPLPGSKGFPPRTWRSVCISRMARSGDHRASSPPVRRSIRALLRSPEDQDAIPGLGRGQVAVPRLRAPSLPRGARIIPLFRRSRTPARTLLASPTTRSDAARPTTARRRTDKA